MNLIRPYVKAVAGFITPGVVLIPAALLPASPGGTSITGYELAAAVAACFATAAGVAAAPKNRPRTRGRVRR